LALAELVARELVRQQVTPELLAALHNLARIFMHTAEEGVEGQQLLTEVVEVAGGLLAPELMREVALMEVYQPTQVSAKLATKIT
jgi:hypothetical protein